jgi:hypothetical protein
VTETQLSAAIREALLATGKVLLWRNNTGKLEDRKGRWVTYGLGVGGADLVGIEKRTGRFVAWEVKTPDGKLSPEQKAWHGVVARAGGAVFVARSVDEALVQLGMLEP